MNNWSELDLLTGLIFGEARSESWSGKIGVGLTVQTRVSHPGHWNWGHNWREVILCPLQFSCFNQADPNLRALVTAQKIRDATWLECTMIAEQIYLGHVKDFVGQPTHYHRFDCSPGWNAKMSTLKKLTFLGTIGKHRFYS